MNRAHLTSLCLLAPLALCLGTSETAVDLSAVADTYAGRLESATTELAHTREAIMEERAPLATEIRQLEKRSLDLKSRIIRMETTHAGMQNSLESLEHQSKSLTGNLDYGVSLARELTATLDATSRTGEGGLEADSLQTIRQDLESSAPNKRHASTEGAFDLALQRIQSSLGGTLVDGLAVEASSNEVREGQFLFLGPVAYFRDSESGAAGFASWTDGAPLPVVRPQSGWDPAVARDVFSGKPGYILADATGGKAIRLNEARGSWLDHVKKGGPVGYIIISLGALALLTAVSKLWDLKGLSVNNPARIKGLAEQVFQCSRSEAADQLRSLKASCRELFSIALQHSDKPKDLLEEILYAYVLLQRNVHEKRLPLLRVIAAAAPLLGLLGTVVGMIKTFTLITVWGTGNAAKLSSGISEALITTELGLIVAIPTLIIHGYLAHQTEKRLSLLEQYSIELVNAVETVDEQPKSGKVVPS